MKASFILIINSFVPVYQSHFLRVVMFCNTNVDSCHTESHTIDDICVSIADLCRTNTGDRHTDIALTLVISIACRTVVSEGCKKTFVDH